MRITVKFWFKSYLMTDDDDNGFADVETSIISFLIDFLYINKILQFNLHICPV